MLRASARGHTQQARPRREADSGKADSLHDITRGTGDRDVPTADVLASFLAIQSSVLAELFHFDPVLPLYANISHVPAGTASQQIQVANGVSPRWRCAADCSKKLSKPNPLFYRQKQLHAFNDYLYKPQPPRPMFGTPSLLLDGLVSRPPTRYCTGGAVLSARANQGHRGLHNRRF